MNLCSNAAHAMRENGGVLKISLSGVELSQKPRRNQKTISSYIKLELEDSGTGIDPEIIDSIFEPYFTTKNRTEGTGFGLALVDRIVQNHNGTITVKSKLDKGTCFQLFFPCSRKDEPIAFVGGQDGSSNERLQPGKARILLVDDEKLQINWCEEFLNHYGFSVESFASPLEAFENFQNDPEAYDIIITDQTMPGLTGTQMVRKVRGIRADIPVVLCTGLPNMLSAKDLRQLNIKNVLPKPIQIKELISVIEKL